MSEQNEHIVIILQRLNPGGAERQACYLASYLSREMGKKVSVFYFGKKDGIAAKWFHNSGVSLIPFGFNEKLLLNNKKSFLTLLRAFRFSIKWILFLRKYSPTILLPFTYQPNIIAGKLWRWTGAKACIWNQRDGGLYFGETAAEIKSLKNCSKWITNSTQGKKFLEKYSLSDIILIPNGVLLPKKTSETEYQGLIRVVMIANIHSNKDHLTLLRAWTLVQERILNQKAVLILAGKFGDCYDDVIQFIKNNRLEENVIMAGTVQDIPSLLETCHIGVLSSNFEGLPNGILECMAAGLPVVATDIEGAKDALGEEYRFLAPVKDSQIMAKHLLTFIQSPDQRTEIGAANRKRIEDHFSIRKMATLFNMQIESLIIC